MILIVGEKYKLMPFESHTWPPKTAQKAIFAIFEGPKPMIKKMFTRFLKIDSDILNTFVNISEFQKIEDKMLTDGTTYNNNGQWLNYS